MRDIMKYAGLGRGAGANLHSAQQHDQTTGRPQQNSTLLLPGQPKTQEVVRLDRGRSPIKKVTMSTNAKTPALSTVTSSVQSGTQSMTRPSEAADFYRDPDRSTIKPADFENDPIEVDVPLAVTR